MIPFHEGVKFITALRHEKDGKISFVEQRLSRALKCFRRWLSDTVDDPAAAIKKVKERGGWPDEMTLGTARNAFQYWKEQDKSRSAKYSRSKRGKKKDERRGARSDKERKAFFSTVETVHGRKGVKMVIAQAMQMAKQKTKP
jgi:ferric-dicitrate binding protein FerR (iron transport regulator)